MVVYVAEEEMGADKEGVFCRDRATHTHTHTHSLTH